MAADPDPRDDPDRSDDQQPTIVVEDPEDFAQTRQLRSIFDARDDYVQARRDANRLCEEKEISFPQKNRRIFRYMQDFAMAMEPLLKAHEPGGEIWEERTYSLDRNFTADRNSTSYREAVELLVKCADGQSDRVDAETARSLLDQLQRDRPRSDVPYSKRNYPDRRKASSELKQEIRIKATDWGWQTDGVGSLVKKTPRLWYKTTKTNKFKTTAPPQMISDAVFRDLQDFIRQIGLGVSFDEEQQTKIDDELLKEVDEWRQKNT
jgi:hypothetical protein